jgi:hypothetical protein
VQDARGIPIIYERLASRINPNIESVRICTVGPGPENVGFLTGGTWVYPELQGRVGLRVKRKCIGEGRRIVVAKVAAEIAAPGGTLELNVGLPVRMVPLRPLPEESTTLVIAAPLGPVSNRYDAIVFAYALPLITRLNPALTNITRANSICLDFMIVTPLNKTAAATTLTPRRCGCGGNPRQFVRHNPSLPLVIRADERRRVKAIRQSLPRPKRRFGRGSAQE